MVTLEKLRNAEKQLNIACLQPSRGPILVARSLIRKAIDDLQDPFEGECVCNGVEPPCAVCREHDPEAEIPF